MKRKLIKTTLGAASVLMAALLATQALRAQDQAPGGVVLHAAPNVAHAQQAELLGVAHAGQRLVAVGDHGVILLSDDAGRQWRQAQQVPFDGLLTSVSFVDERQGWAVGHAGVILHTQDAGQTWQLQRSDTAADRPLFAVHFFDAQHGVAVGLWSLVLVTDDGGKTWAAQTLTPPEGARKADLNLLSLFVNTKGELFASAEKGMVLRSADQGHTWTYLNTGYQGSFWTGTALADGTLVVGGLRGSLYRSGDDGRTWERVDSHTRASITALTTVTQDGQQQVVGTGLDGVLLRSTDGAQTFTATVRDDRRALTGVAVLPDKPLVLLSRSGVVLP